MSDETDRINTGMQISSMENMFVVDTEEYMPLAHYILRPDPPVEEGEEMVHSQARKEFRRVYERYGRKPAYYLMGIRAYARFCLEAAKYNTAGRLMTHIMDSPIVLDRDADKNRISGIFEVDEEIARILGGKP